MELDDLIIPGRIHEIILTSKPLLREYRQKGSLFVDNNLRNMGSHITSLLQDNGVKFISLRRDNIVEGRSWEMAAAHAIRDRVGVYSGTVDSYVDGVITFGPVPGVAVKKTLSIDLKTSENVRML